MKFYRLTFFASLFLTAVTIIVVLLFDKLKSDFDHTEPQFFWGMAISALIIAILNYFVLEFLFNYYGKKQIKKISTILPVDFMQEDRGLNFKELGERVTELDIKRSTEIDTMKEMENYRKEYIGNVSHELKTPLFSIQGYVSTLIEGGVENPSIRDKYLQRIEKSVERILNIVNDLDSINQYESGEITLTVDRFDINNVVKDTFELLEMEAQKKDAMLQLTTAQNQIFVYADKNKISQVLLNLVSNAIHYANRDKAIIRVHTNILRNKVLVEVADNGMGIKPEALPRIFERFYRVETSRSRNQGGSGLGLAIVKHIMEAHQTNINVESKYLEGTKFSFLLEKSSS